MDQRQLFISATFIVLLAIAAVVMIARPATQTCVSNPITLDNVYCGDVDTVAYGGTLPNPADFLNGDMIFVVVQDQYGNYDLWFYGPRFVSGNPPNFVPAWRHTVKLVDN